VVCARPRSDRRSRLSSRRAVKCRVRPWARSRGRCSLKIQRLANGGRGPGTPSCAAQPPSRATARDLRGNTAISLSSCWVPTPLQRAAAPLKQLRMAAPRHRQPATPLQRAAAPLKRAVRPPPREGRPPTPLQRAAAPLKRRVLAELLEVAIDYSAATCSGSVEAWRTCLSLQPHACYSAATCSGSVEAHRRRFRLRRPRYLLRCNVQRLR
jgi:hypothetical protein